MFPLNSMSSMIDSGPLSARVSKSTAMPSRPERRFCLYPTLTQTLSEAIAFASCKTGCSWNLSHLIAPETQQSNSLPSWPAAQYKGESQARERREYRSPSSSIADFCRRPKTLTQESLKCWSVCFRIATNYIQRKLATS